MQSQIRQSSNSNAINSQGIKQLVDEELKCAFHMFDMKGTGKIQLQDFGTLMRALGFSMTEELAYQIVNKIDLEGLGTISFDQFKNYFLGKVNNEEVKKQFFRAFKVIDLDGDGYISTKDLTQFLQSVGQLRSQEQIREMMRDADVDGDEHINYEQFIRLMLTR